MRRKVVLPLAGALLAASGVAIAADDDADSGEPASSIAAGVGSVSKDNQHFGEYSGLKDKGGYGLLDVYINKRYDDTGTWVTLTGRNLGLDSRDLRFENERQGNWGYFIDFSETPRNDPFTVSTRLTGIGTNSEKILGSATPQQYELGTKRKAWTLGFDKSLTGLLPGLSVRMRFRDEDKDGTRLFGEGTFTNLAFLVDPISYNTKQAEVTFNYTAAKLQLSGGYYGTWFTNKNLALSIQNNPAAYPTQPFALPPGNQSNGLNLGGGYNFSDSLRGTFKASYSRATQNDAFVAATATPTLPASLNAVVDTTEIQGGLNWRATSKLTVRADYRYYNHDDKTPVYTYFPAQAASATSTNVGTNEPLSYRKEKSTLEANYRLPMGFRLTGGADYESIWRNNPPLVSVDFRDKTYETTWRAELRRSMSDSLIGAIGLLQSSRRGSSWNTQALAQVNGVATTGVIAPLNLIDRDRDTIRLTLTWTPIDPLSLNF
ncbi:MAG TPA: MtrB/PioB family decaheme-associated outer membrane protein, partial [Burkholderiales bacterium]|nr:MtrB/PioB family decaheme-associated outer membrane protein [Burkholderiales bacterium]